MSRAVGYAAVVCAGLTLGYGEAPVLADVDLAVADGEVVALLGPSGSGKTTLLQAIAGFVEPVAGSIRLGGREVAAPRSVVPPERRGIGMVFQTYALWPHMSALDTVAYPLRRRGVGRAAARQRAYDLLRRVGVTELAERRPGQLSGGEQQRVGLARALAGEPAVYLFDEPTAHLDAHLRATVSEQVARQRAATRAAAVYATHDAGEALSLADRVAVLHTGRLAQVGTPAEIYARPVDQTVARLTGPVSVLTTATHRLGAQTVEVVIGEARSTVRCGGRDTAGTGGIATGAALLVRPDWARLGGPFDGEVAAVRFHGPHTDYHVATRAGTVVVREPGPSRLTVGARVSWSLREAWPVEHAG